MPEEPSESRVILGVERVLACRDKVLGRLAAASSVALLTNDGTRVPEYPAPSDTEVGDGPRPSRDIRPWHENSSLPSRRALAEASIPSRRALAAARIPLTHLLTPEHGLSAAAPDGVAVPSTMDRETGLPVTSLYGDDLRPDPRLLRDLDLVLVDLQDVGARFYTYLWTVSHLMEACAETGVPVRILDRPNPLGGRPEWVEGPLPDPDAPSTFLGRWPIPVRHSLTLGEMTLLLRAEMGLELDLDVVAMEGWERDQLWPDTGLPYHPPSPGLPTFDSALLYPGMAFLEATNVMEGRGSDLAFRWLGAPWMEASTLADALNRTGAGDVRAHPHALDMARGEAACPGVLLEVTHPEFLRPVALGLRLLSFLPTLWPERFSWVPYPTAVNPRGEDHLLRLLGRDDVADILTRTPGEVRDQEIEDWTRAPGWWPRAQPHLLYD